MVNGRNTVVLRFSRVAAEAPGRKALPAAADVRLTVRVDLEDRSFHAETKRTGGAEHHFNTHCHPWPASDHPTTYRSTASPPPTSGSDRPFVCGFAFTPTRERQLRVGADAGAYHPQPEWSENIPHPVEQSRGQMGAGDAFSPGWFELPLASGRTVTIVVSAEVRELSIAELEQGMAGESQVLVTSTQHEHGPTGSSGDSRSNVTHHASRPTPHAPRREPQPADPQPYAAAATSFAQRLTSAARAFVVRRDDAQTVIAGYPWFLDWGRDTLICARGLLAAGMRDTVIQLLQVFGRFERHGTLPNTIHGEDASNRDTSDAPLWYGVVCEELAGADPGMLCELRVAPGGRTIAEVLQSIAVGYVRGTPNGIRMDPASALIWSPSHFTWMDTNYPACTPREGYPVEIQALWIRLLRTLDRLGAPTIAGAWSQLALRAQASLEARYWLREPGYLADVLLASAGQPAASATPQQALRPNSLFPVALGVVTGDTARRTVEAVRQHLLVPGALRSLAPLPVTPPLPIHSHDGRLLNDPPHPYWGHYAGDEDTRRKPAYHNGTAWVWTLPSFCEALARAWDLAPGAVEAARAYLGSMEALLEAGCLGQLPEILDGDAPHAQRGCDAQAWSATETLRVWHWLETQARS
jgi:glycogen debranching enzyme